MKKVLQLRRCCPSGHSQSLRREDSCGIPSRGRPSDHDSIRQCFPSLRTSSMNQVTLFAVHHLHSHIEWLRYAHHQTGSDKLRKVYHGQTEGKRWSVHMTQIKLWAIICYLGETLWVCAMCVCTAKNVKGLVYGPIKSKHDISSTSIVVWHTLLNRHSWPMLSYWLWSYT